MENQTVLDLDEVVSLSRRPDRFLNLNGIILGLITDKVLNLDIFPPSWIMDEFLNLNRIILCWSTDNS